ncbi:MAG: DNA polymerase III subunit gamma/tau [Bdellovibrio sp.]
MSYQVIARKWRPQTLQELVGQNHISTTLLNALRNSRLPHSLLFTGVRGTGKTSTARILAKSIRCPRKQDFVPCLQCADCADIAAGRAVDVVEIDGASNNGVDSVRELRESVHFRPSSGTHKIYIIDEVHMLSTSAFNALLKTLEEPPEHIIFILATTEVQKIPQTILSRCQKFDFRRISTHRISEHLRKICEAEKVQITDEALWTLARQGDGSMRDSQSLLDQVISFARGPIDLSSVTEILGLTDRSLVRQMLQAIFARDPRAMVFALEKAHVSGQVPQALLESLLEMFRHALVLKLKPESFSDLPDSEVEWLKEMLREISDEDLHVLFDLALKGAQEVARVKEPDLLLDIVCLRLAQAPRVKHLFEILRGTHVGTHAALPISERPSSASQILTQVKTQPPSQQTKWSVGSTTATVSASPAPTSTSEAPIGLVAGISAPDSDLTAWISFVRQLKQRDAFLAAKVDPLVFVELRPMELVLAVPAKFSFLKEQLQEPTQRERLEKALELFWKSPRVLVLQTEKTASGLSVQRHEENQKKRQQDDLRERVLHHPRVQSLNEILKAEVKSIEPIVKPTDGKSK